jgi:methionyl-tRNA formyltransferase
MELEKPRIVCVGSNIESFEVIKFFKKNNVKVTGLVCLPKRLATNISDYFDMKDAVDDNTKIIFTEDINNKKTINSIKKLKPQYIFVLGWSQLFKKELLSIPTAFVVGSHPTPLPLRKGRAPLPWTILGDFTESAVTLFKMTPKIDDGDILIQKYFKIPKNTDVSELYKLSSRKLAESFYELYQNIISNKVRFKKPSKTSKESFRGKRVPEDGFLDFNLASKYLHKLIRAITYPFPGSYFYHGDTPVRCFKSRIYDGPERLGVVGQIVGKTKEGIIVHTSSGAIELEELFIDDKSINNKSFKTGEVLNYRIHDEINSLKKYISYLEKRISALEG